jgi:hypothetical protein
MYIKLLAANCCHHGFTYKEGLNVDTLPFNPSGECLPGGLYYTTLEHLPFWFNDRWPLVADVVVPADARVYEEPCRTKWKADRLVLSRIRSLDEFLAELNQAWLCRLVYQCPGILWHVRDQTDDEVCLAAVQRHGHALQYIRNPTEAVLMAAVQQNGFALKMCPNQTEALCLAAVQQDGMVLRLVRNQTEAICRAALAQNPWVKCYVKIPLH